MSKEKKTKFNIDIYGPNFDSEKARRVAKPMNKSDAWISKVTREMINPNAKDKKRLAKILGRPVSELFTSRTKG
jgi:hypothetical protein